MPRLRASTCRLPALAGALGTALLGLALVGGCDLPLPRSAVTVSDRRICLEPLENNTPHKGLAGSLDRRLQLAFEADGRMRVTRDPRHCDLILKGEIQQYLLEATRWDKNNIPIGFKLRMAVDLALIDVKTGHLLWATQAGSGPASASDSDRLDSLDPWTLQEEKDYYRVNTQGLPSEDDFAARDELLDAMASRAVQKVFSGF